MQPVSVIEDYSEIMPLMFEEHSWLGICKKYNDI